MKLSLNFNALSFNDRSAWRKWLAENGETEKEIWLIYYKKHTGVQSVTYHEALEEALCYGWIDSLVKSIDESTYKQKYTPRLKNSRWSERNKKIVTHLLAEGRMTEQGLESIKGWINETSDNLPVIVNDEASPDLASALLTNKKASETFIQLPPSQKRNIIRWINSSKRAETIRKRVTESIRLLEKGQGIGMR
jgi:uncharacterized protein YdeI (YjbR/CyaY-like superfamily)